MNLGKQIRMQSFFKHGNAIIVPMDHGITNGPIKGIDDIKNMVLTLGKTKVDGVILHKGIISACEKEIEQAQLPVIMHLSAGTDLSTKKNYKVIVGTVAEAIAFGCQAVSVHINVGNEYEEEMIRDVSKVAEDCYKYGMPLLAMMYPRGDGIRNCDELTAVKHAARIGAEIGADFVKVQFTGGNDFHEVVAGCPVPVIIAGGDKKKEKEFLTEIKEAMDTGIQGVSIGRNIFQSADPEVLVEKLHQIVHINNFV